MGGRFPVLGQEFIDSVVGVLGDSWQDVREVLQRVHAVGGAGGQYGQQVGKVLTALFVPYKQRVFAVQSDHPQCPF